MHLHITASGSLPGWKRALVKPPHKGGLRDTFTNSRLLSALPIGKYNQEGRDQVTAYLEDYNLLLPWQSGFHAGYHITSALLQVTKHLLTALDQGLVIELIFRNTSKTFHMVHHQLLLARLRVFGLNPVTCGWSHRLYKVQKRWAGSHLFHSENLFH